MPGENGHLRNLGSLPAVIREWRTTVAKMKFGCEGIAPLLKTTGGPRVDFTRGRIPRRRNPRLVGLRLGAKQHAGYPVLSCLKGRAFNVKQRTQSAGVTQSPRYPAEFLQARHAACRKGAISERVILDRAVRSTAQPWKCGISAYPLSWSRHQISCHQT